METIIAQAQREFPNECCGFVIGNEACEEVRPIANIQDRLHAQSPSVHPRDARTAYAMDPKELLALEQELDRRKLAIRIVYHSHPDHDAYFSPMDRERACFYPREPTFPDAANVVMSIMAGKFVRAAAFVWDSLQEDFVEATLVLR